MLYNMLNSLLKWIRFDPQNTVCSIWCSVQFSSVLFHLEVWQACQMVDCKFVLSPWIYTHDLLTSKKPFENVMFFQVWERKMYRKIKDVYYTCTVVFIFRMIKMVMSGSKLLDCVYTTFKLIDSLRRWSVDMLLIFINSLKKVCFRHCVSFCFRC